MKQTAKRWSYYQNSPKMRPPTWCLMRSTIPFKCRLRGSSHSIPAFDNSWTIITAPLGNYNDLSAEKAPRDGDVVKSKQPRQNLVPDGGLHANNFPLVDACPLVVSQRVFLTSFLFGKICLPEKKNSKLFFFPFSITMSVVPIKSQQAKRAIK